MPPGFRMVSAVSECAGSGTGDCEGFAASELGKVAECGGGVGVERA